MATQTVEVVVCDFCGAETALDPVDVCADHAPTKPRKKKKRVACEVCGQRVTPGPGLAAHMRTHAA